MRDRLCWAIDVCYVIFHHEFRDFYIRGHAFATARVDLQLSVRESRVAICCVKAECGVGCNRLRPNGLWSQLVFQRLTGQVLFQTSIHWVLDRSVLVGGVV